MNGKSVSIYKMYVYEDGKVALKPLTLNNGGVNTQGVSSSIRQIVKVIEHVAQSSSKSGIRRKVNEAIYAVAESEGITVSPVHAKLTRKLGLSMKQFKDQVEDYFNNNDETLKETLQSACVGRTKVRDNAAIEQLFKMIKIKRFCK